jgi:hypothetical protein
MDRITKSLVDDFILNQGITPVSESSDFEKFSNFSIVSLEYQKSFDIDFVTVGDGNDTALDGIAILVNGVLIENTDEIDDLLEKNGFLEVEFIFIQSKTSSSFDSGEIGKFLYGVKDFFSETPTLVRNTDITNFAELSDYIMSKAPSFRANPTLKLFYVTTGTWTSDQNLSAVLNNGKTELENLNLFETVATFPFGTNELVRTYRKSKEAISTTFEFNSRITLPTIEGITQSYIGMIPYSEFKKIIVDENDRIQNVFEDNVRDFQGESNDVNKGIVSTITGDSTDLFGVLNNGVTIVTTSLNNTGNTFTIKDYQIVNGCQTSNVIYNNRDSVNIDSLHIPIKIIATENEDVKNQITFATNSQTQIKKEQLASVTQFQRHLEQYYNSFEGDKKLYYERRSKQYNRDASIIKNKIITIPYQIKAFSSMFLQNPHMVTSYFGSIVKKLNNQESIIFNEDHAYAPYYLSGFAFYKLETLFRKRLIDAKYKKVRYHLIFLYKKLASANETVPPLNSTRLMERYCNKIIDKLSNETESLAIFNQAILIFEESSFDLDDKQHVKLKNKTDELVRICNEKINVA